MILIRIAKLLKKFNLAPLFRVMEPANQLEQQQQVDDSTAETSAKKPKLNDEPTTTTITETVDTAAKEAIKKRKYALLISYCGEGYYGLQRNASIKTGEFPTIEDEIVKGLIKVNAIPQSHADEMFKV